jgi:hypothetical protein
MVAAGACRARGRDRGSSRDPVTPPRELRVIGYPAARLRLELSAEDLAWIGIGTRT